MKTKLLILGAVAWLLLSLPLSAIDHLDLITSMSGEFNGSYFGNGMIAMDFNGDGYDDLIVNSTNWNTNGVYNDAQRWGRIYFYWGGPEFDNVPDYIITASHNYELYSYNIFNGGDINGDGIDDLVVNRNARPHTAVYYGGSSPSGTPDLIINSIDPDEYIDPQPLGDINCDGHADIAILSDQPFTGFSKIYAWTGIDEPWHELVSTSSTFGYVCAGPVGDVNSDGYADYVLQYAISGGDNSNIKIVLYYGDPSFPQVDSLVISENTNEVPASRAGCLLGDLNNDGHNDFTAYSGRIWYGSSNITSVNDLAIDFDTQYHQWGHLTNNTGPDFVYGDLNGDGYDDIVASNAYISYYDGEVGIWLGGPNMNGNCNLYLYPPVDYGSRNFGWAKAMGDFNGDGLCDLAVSAPYWGPNSAPLWAEGRVYVYSGSTQLVANEDLLVPECFDSSWQIDVFPNPSASGSSINVDFQGDAYKQAKQVTLDIYNLKGQKLNSVQVSNPDSSYQLPNQITSKLSVGLYIIAVHNDAKPLFKTKICIIK